MVQFYLSMKNSEHIDQVYRLQSKMFEASSLQFITSGERPKSASYLRLNNIQGKTQPIFHLSHNAEKSRKRFPRNSKTVFFLHWKHQKKLICL